MEESYGLKSPKPPKKTPQQRRAESAAAEQGSKDRARLRAEERLRKSRLQGKSLLTGGSGETGLGLSDPQPAASNQLGIY